MRASCDGWKPHVEAQAGTAAASTFGSTKASAARAMAMAPGHARTDLCTHTAKQMRNVRHVATQGACRRVALAGLVSSDEASVVAEHTPVD